MIKELIQFKRLPRATWAGVPKYTNAVDGIAPFVDRVSGYPATGLNDADARRLEKSLRLVEGELAPRSEFWTEFFVPIGDETLYLDSQNPEDELKYLFLKAHKLVQNGYNDLKAKAEFVLFTEQEEAKENNVKRKYKKEAWAIFHKMSPNEMLDAMTVMGEKVENVEPEIIEDRLGDIVESRAKQFVEILGHPRYTDRIFLMKLLKYGIISKNRGFLSVAPLFYGKQPLGEGWEAAAAFLSNPAHMPILSALQDTLNSAVKQGTIVPEVALNVNEIVPPEIMASGEVRNNEVPIPPVAPREFGEGVKSIVRSNEDSGEYGGVEQTPAGVGRGKAKK